MKKHCRFSPEGRHQSDLIFKHRIDHGVEQRFIAQMTILRIKTCKLVSQLRYIRNIRFILNTRLGNLRWSPVLW